MRGSSGLDVVGLLGCFPTRSWRAISRFFRLSRMASRAAVGSLRMATTIWSRSSDVADEDIEREAQLAECGCSLARLAHHHQDGPRHEGVRLGSHCVQGRAAASLAGSSGAGLKCPLGHGSSLNAC